MTVTTDLDTAHAVALAAISDARTWADIQSALTAYLIVLKAFVDAVTVP